MKFDEMVSRTLTEARMDVDEKWAKYKDKVLAFEKELKKLGFVRPDSYDPECDLWIDGIDDDYVISYQQNNQDFRMDISYEIGEDFETREFDWNQTKSALKFVKGILKRINEFVKK